jgi:hypothetical protein
MKSPADYIAESYLRADRLKQASTNAKRAAGCINSELERTNFHGLTEKERKTLTEAVNLLNKMAANISAASSMKAKTEKAFDARWAEAKKKATPIFSKLQTPREWVPLVAMTVERGSLNTPEYLKSAMHIERLIEGAIHDISYGVAKKAGSIDVLLQDAMSAYLAEKPRHERRYQHLIEMLEQQKI